MADTVKNIWLNYVAIAMTHKVTANGKDFTNVSFDCTESANGIATVSVNNEQIKASTNKDGAEVAGYVNVLLGAPGSKRKVSVLQADGSYGKVEMTVEQIQEYFTAGREAFRAQAAAKAPAEAPEA